VKDDIFIIDFDGDPRLPLAEKRRKARPRADVAGLVRSIELAAAAGAQCALNGTSDEQGRLAAALGEWPSAPRPISSPPYREAITDRRLWPMIHDLRKGC